MNYALVKLAHGIFPCVVLHETEAERVVETLRGTRMKVERAAVVTAEEAFSAAHEITELRADVAQLAREMTNTPAPAPVIEESQPTPPAASPEPASADPIASPDDGAPSPEPASAAAHVE